MNDTFQEVLSYAEEKMSEGDYLLVANTLKKVIQEKDKKKDKKPIWKEIGEIDLVCVLSNDDASIRIGFEKVYKDVDVNRVGTEFYVKVSIRDDDGLELVTRGLFDNIINGYITAIKPTKFKIIFNGMIISHNGKKVFEKHCDDIMTERKGNNMLNNSPEDIDDDDDCWNLDVDNIFQTFIRITIRDLFFNKSTEDYMSEQLNNDWPC